MVKLEKFTKDDVVTPANGITLLGLILVIIGCFYLNELSGLFLVALGRFMDLLDGPVARATGVTRFSIVFDPFTDKIAIAAILFSSLWFGLVPWPVVLFIIFQNLLTIVLALRKYKNKNKIGATILGKLNMFFQTTTVLLFILSSLTPTGLSALLIVLAYANFIACLPLGLMSAITYTSSARR